MQFMLGLPVYVICFLYFAIGSIDGKIFVPLRSVMNALGVQVKYPALFEFSGEWNGYRWKESDNLLILNSIGLIKGGTSVLVFIGGNKAYKIPSKENWDMYFWGMDYIEPITLDAPPRIINSKTVVPLRFIAQSFGYNVEWDSESRSVFISLPEENFVKTVVQTQSSKVYTVLTDKGQGTGFVTGWAAEGKTAVVMTCYHVIEDAEFITLIRAC